MCAAKKVQCSRALRNSRFCSSSEALQYCHHCHLSHLPDEDVWANYGDVLQTEIILRADSDADAKIDLVKKNVNL